MRTIHTTSSRELIRELLAAVHVIQADAAYAGWTFAVVSVDPGLLDDTIERVNITLPRRVLKRLDALARAAGETRSGYIAQLPLGEHSREV